MPEINDKPVTKDYLEIVIGRLENKIDAKFNSLEAKINNQRYYILATVLAVLAQIVNAWILHK